MAKLLSTGVSISGYTSWFVYDGTAEDQACVMTCRCGWSTPFESFGHPHSIIECQRRFNRHLADLSVGPSAPQDNHQALAESEEEHT